MDPQTPLATESAAPRWHGPARVVGLVGTSLLVGAFPSFSLRSTVTLIGVGGALFWMGLSRRFARHPVVRRVGREAAWWLAPVLLFAVVELVNFAMGSTPAHPTLSALADPVLDHYWARSAVFLGWMTGYWGLVRR